MLVLHTQKLLHGVHYQQSLDYCSKVATSVSFTWQVLNIFFLNFENICINFPYCWQHKSCVSSNLYSLPAPLCPLSSLLLKSLVWLWHHLQLVKQDILQLQSTVNHTTLCKRLLLLSPTPSLPYSHY